MEKLKKPTTGIYLIQNQNRVLCQASVGTMIKRGISISEGILGNYVCLHSAYYAIHNTNYGLPLLHNLLIACLLLLLSLKKKKELIRKGFSSRTKAYFNHLENTHTIVFQVPTKNKVTLGTIKRKRKKITPKERNVPTVRRYFYKKAAFYLAL